MENTSKSVFKFEGYTILKSILSLKKNRLGKELSIHFEPRGIIKQSEALFFLQMDVLIQDKEDNIKLELGIEGDFSFNDININKESLDKYFYVNAPAILFPYIRAYVATLTSLSGMFPPITLPTMNLSNLGQRLKENTTEEA